MYIHYSIGNNSEPQTLVCIVEVSLIGESVFGGSTVYGTGFHTEGEGPWGHQDF